MPKAQNYVSLELDKEEIVVYFSNDSEVNLDQIIPNGGFRKETVYNDPLLAQTAPLPEIEFKLSSGNILFIKKESGWTKYTII